MQVASLAAEREHELVDHDEVRVECKPEETAQEVRLRVQIALR